jgi:polysaccharide deacetylase family protein (PEP-CTERM system associated)
VAPRAEERPTLLREAVFVRIRPVESSNPPAGWQESPIEGILVDPAPSADPADLAHVISVDLEDWRQSVFDHSLPVSDDFHRGTERLLDLLDRHSTRATFFVLANVAEHSPALIRRIRAAGHEIQSHGLDHVELNRLTPERFRRDLARAKAMIEDVIGEPVTGYRAPRFSITAETVWALDILAESGFRYDSSVFPMRVRGYGIQGWPAGPARVRTRNGSQLTEVPVSTAQWWGRRWPVGGGGYLRLLPSRLVRQGLRSVVARGRPIVLYIHPYELDSTAISALRLNVPLMRRIHQGLGRRSVAGKLATLLQTFRFGPMGRLVPTIGPPSPADAPVDSTSNRRS